MRGLPRPLLAVLLGQAKMYAFQMVMETAFPESAAGSPFAAGQDLARGGLERVLHLEQRAMLGLRGQPLRLQPLAQRGRARRAVDLQVGRDHLADARLRLGHQPRDERDARRC